MLKDMAIEELLSSIQCRLDNVQWENGKHLFPLPPHLLYYQLRLHFVYFMYVSFCTIITLFAYFIKLDGDIYSDEEKVDMLTH